MISYIQNYTLPAGCVLIYRPQYKHYLYYNKPAYNYRIDDNGIILTSTSRDGPIIGIYSPRNFKLLSIANVEYPK